MAFGSNQLTLLIKAKDEASSVLNNIRGNINKHSADFARAGKQMLIASAALTAGIGVSINEAAKFQQQMAQVSTMLDDQSMKYMPKYEKSIKSMSLEFGESTSTLADGLYNILSASVPAENAMSVLDASVRAAKAGLTDTGVAADAITTIINSYQLEASRAADVSDLLFSIVKRGKLTFAELAPNIGKVSSMAYNAGMSLEELGATISTLTRSGIRTEMAMTAVRGILNGVMKPADEAAALFEDKLGLALDTTTLKSEGLIGILKRMKEAKLAPEELSKMFPNVRALTGVIAAMGSLEGATYDYKVMVERAGTSQEAFEKNFRTASNSLARMKQAIIMLSAELGENFLPIVIKVGNMLVSMAKWFSSLSKITKILLGVVISLTAALAGFAGAALIVISKIPFLVSGFQTLGITMTAATAKVIAFKIAMGAGFVAVMVAAGYAVFQLMSKVMEYGDALSDLKDATIKAESTHNRAFTTMISKFSELKNKFQELLPENEKQTEAITKMIDNYRILASSGLASSELLMEEENKLIDKITEWIGVYRNKITARQEGAVIQSELDSQELESTRNLTDKEREMFEKLNLKVMTLSDNEYNVKRKRLAMEYKEKETTAKKELKNAIKYNEYMLKLDYWRHKESVKISRDEAKAKRTAAFNVADYSIQALQTALEYEGSSAKKKKSYIIGLIAMEKALAIARVWAAHASIPFAGTAIAAAQTALIIAQFAVIMKNMRASSSNIDSSSIVSSSSLSSAEDSSSSAADVPSYGESDSGGVASTGGFAGSPVATGGGGGEGNKITNINIDGIEVILGGFDNTALRENNIETTLRDIGEAVKAKTVEGITMAMRIYNAGKENEEEAV